MFFRILRKKITWIFLIVLGLACTGAWIAYSKVTTSKNASEFEQWIGSVEKDFARSTTPQDFPDVAMKLESRSSSATPQFSWTIQAGHTEDSKSSNEQIMRLLDLVREAKIFAESRSPSSDIQLTVTQNQKTFKAFFNKEDIEKNIPLGSFVKLFQIYATQKPSA